MINKELVRPIGSIGQDNLIAHIEPKAHTTGINVKADAGKLKRGTVLYRTEDGNYDIYGGDVTIPPEEEGGEPTVKHVEPSIILTEDADPSVATAAVGYRTGYFNRHALIFADGYTMTDADVDTMRKYGILVGDFLD